MEDKGNCLLSSREWPSQGKFKLEWSQGFKESMQIENRLKILEIEKQRKIKQIQKKLDFHKKNVELKITKYQRHRDVENMHSRDRMNVTMYFNHFQNDRKQREKKIKVNRGQLQKSRNKQFWSIKKQSECNLQKINEERLIELEEKNKKRNKVRMMEIVAKENIVSSWNQRLWQMKKDRHALIEKKMKEHDENLGMISKMEKKEKKILQEIYKADEMEEEVSQMITFQSKMPGDQLSRLYEKKP